MVGGEKNSKERIPEGLSASDPSHGGSSSTQPFGGFRFETIVMVVRKMEWLF